jgi:hypothetical protein
LQEVAAMATVTAPAHARSWQHSFRAVWAAALTGLFALLFTGLTVLTVTLWATDPTYTQTNPVVDLAFFALGIVIAAGFASQTRIPTIAGLQQATIALATLAAAGWLGGRIEPFVGPFVLLLAATPLAVFHPDRRQLVAAGAGVSRALAVLAAVAAAPAFVYAADMLDRARAAEPSCFLGQCAHGDRYAEAAALAVAVVLVALLASVRTPGWMLPAWSAGTAAAVLGVASLLFPAQAGALTGAWAVAAVIWGGAVIAIAHVQHRAATAPARHDEQGR